MKPQVQYCNDHASWSEIVLGSWLRTLKTYVNKIKSNFYIHPNNTLRNINSNKTGNKQNG